MKELQIGDGKVKLDDEDFDKVVNSPYKWYIGKNGYAFGWLPGIQPRVYKYMHRFIMEYDGKDDIDHINRDKLDNQKKNLRVVPRHVNLHNAKLAADNTTGYKGTFKNPRGVWGYYYDIKGRRYTKQGFKSALEAREARISALSLRGIVVHNP